MTNSDSNRESPEARMTVYGVQIERNKPRVETGSHALTEPEFENQKRVFPLTVIKKDDGTIVVKVKDKDGKTIATKKLDEVAAEHLLKARKIKENPVKAREVKPKTTKSADER